MDHPVVGPCPDAATLERLLLGLAAAAEAERLEGHLASCPTCVARAATLQPQDVLVQAMHHSNPDATSPEQPLIDAIMPLLKRMRPTDATTTMPPRDGESEGAGGSTTGSLGTKTTLEPLQRESLGGYRIVRQLGHGGMGVVYVAEDTQLRRQIALKVIRPELVTRADLRERFLSEARAIAAVEHDHIVSIFHVGEDDGILYLAMPLLRGKTLEERLRQANSPLPVDELLRIARQTAEGLAAAHERGLVHRDVKPNNIFLESLVRGPSATSVVRGPSSVVKESTAHLSLTMDDGPRTTDYRVKLLDFGLARLVDESGGPIEGTVTGTPAYMSPEQGRGEAVDARCDLFSLGCVLYRMAAGRPAFSGRDVLAVLVNVALDQPTPLASLNPDLPPALVALIDRLLAKQREDRPASAQAVLAELRAIEEARAAARRPRPRRLPWLAACVLVAVAAMGITWWLMPPAEPLPPGPGTVTFEFDAPDGRLVLKHDNDPEHTVDVRVDRTVTLPPGEYSIRLAEPQKGRTLMPDRILVNSGAAITTVLRLVGLVGEHRLHTRPVRAVALSPLPGSLLALSASDDNTVVAWNAAGDDAPWTLGEHEDPVHCVAFSPDGKRAASGSGGRPPLRRKSDNTVRLWDLDGRRPLATLARQESWVTSVAFSRDGQQLLSGGLDGSLVLWDLQTNAVRRRLAGHLPARVRSLQFAMDGQQALSCGDDNSVRILAIADGRLLRIQKHANGVAAATYAPNGRRVAWAGLDGLVCVWDLTTDARRDWKGHEGAVHCGAWLPDGRRLVSGGEDGKVRLWNADTGDELLCLHGHTRMVSGVAVSVDGRYALSGSTDHFVRLWELPN
jgi:WD40 repeat protein/serine/threonine protein kinase